MEKKIVAKIAELSETENITVTTRLKDLETWDSLAVISYMVFAKSELGAQFENVQLIETAQTVGDLCNLTLERIK